MARPRSSYGPLEFLSRQESLKYGPPRWPDTNYAVRRIWIRLLLSSIRNNPLIFGSGVWKWTRPPPLPMSNHRRNENKVFVVLWLVLWILDGEVFFFPLPRSIQSAEFLSRGKVEAAAVLGLGRRPEELQSEVYFSTEHGRKFLHLLLVKCEPDTAVALFDLTLTSHRS